ncbi:MAG: enoyl-CoA hydratase-related protein [bacterium]
MSEPELLYEVKNGAAWLTINREAKRNALSGKTLAQLDKALDRAAEDDAVRVLCITGAGKKSFCSGADLTSLGGGDPAEAMRAYAALLKRMDDYPKPLVARVDGHCLAGGTGLLLSCDIAYARQSVMFGTPELNVGLFPMMIGKLIFRAASRMKAMEMIYTGRKLTAAEAEEMGLITRAYPDEELDAAVQHTLDAIAEKAPVAARIGRQALAAVAAMDLGEALDYLCDKLGEVLTTEDAMEGLMAFLQKRKPEWKGR